MRITGFTLLLTFISTLGWSQVNLTQSNFTGVVVPQYMAGPNIRRLPIIFRATVSGLTPNTTYRYFIQGGASSDFGTQETLVGFPLLLNSAGNSYKVATNPSLINTAGYETFTTASGQTTYTGWFGLINNQNHRFGAGNTIFPCIVVGNNNGTALFRLALDVGITMLHSSTTTNIPEASRGSFYQGTTFGPTAKNIVALYDNVAGSGRPLFVAPIESIQATINNIIPGYSTTEGSWNAIIPNINANGVRAIVQYASSATGSTINAFAFGSNTNALGFTGSVNPRNGAKAVILTADAPLTTLSTAANGNWTATSTWVGGALPVASASTSSATVSINHDITLSESLTNSGSLSIGSTGSLTINPNVTFTVSGTANFANRLVTINSTAAGSGSIGTITGSLTNATNVRVLRYVPNNNPANNGNTVYRRWRFFSLPVMGTSLRQFFTGKTNTGDALTDAGDATQNNIGTLLTGHQRTATGDGFDWWPALVNGAILASSNIRYFTAANGFSSATNTPNVTEINPNQQGYMVFIRGDRRNTLTTSETNATTLPSLGELRIGNQTIAIPNQPLATLGNPYVSPIDFAAVRANTGNDAIIQNRFWMWDPHLSTAGAWRLVKQVRGNWRAVPTPFNEDGVTEDEGNVQHIQSGQAVMVEPITAGNLLIEENDKSNNSGFAAIRPFEANSAATGLVMVNLSLSDKGSWKLADGVLAAFDSSNKQDLTDENDVAKFSNTFSALGMAILRQGSRLTTEGRPADMPTDTLFLQTIGLAANQQYRFSVNTTGTPLEGKHIKLVDQFTGTTTDLAPGSTTQIEFTPNSDLNSTANNRFYIVLNGSITLPVSFTRIVARAQQGDVAIEWAVAAETGVMHYEIEHSNNGRNFDKIGVVVARNNGPTTYNYIHKQPGSGNHYYRLRSEDTNGKFQLTQVVKMSIESNKKSFKVHPTLVTGNYLTLALNGLVNGSYTLQLNDMAGKTLMNTTFPYNGGSLAQNVQLPADLAPGIYLILLQSEESSYSQKIVKE